MRREGVQSHGSSMGQRANERIGVHCSGKVSVCVVLGAKLREESRALLYLLCLPPDQQADLGGGSSI